jgi:hypothetical protein
MGAWNAALRSSRNGALGVERYIGHLFPRTPDCRRHAQRFEMPGDPTKS